MRKFDVGGMSCAACSARVEKAVSSLPGVKSCSVNLLTASMVVEGDISDKKIVEAVTAAGYSASPKDVKNRKNVNESSQKSAHNAILTRLISSSVLLIALMYIAMGHVMYGLPVIPILDGNTLAIAIAEMLLSACVLVINQRFFINGAKGAFKLAPNMDTLVALGSGASFIYSVAQVFVMSAEYALGDFASAEHRLHGLYFESAAMILVLITVGKLLESRAKGKTADAIAALVKLSPKTATVIRDGREAVISAEDVAVGDIFVVRPGERIPVDGVVAEGESEADESALTGESMPKDKKPGAKVLAATVNISGYLKCRATEVGEQTTIAGVIKLVEDANATKAPISKIADKVSGVFVPFVIAIALIAFGAWRISGADVGYALARGISVLVISCPCALGLATPVAIMVSSGVGARLGILYKSAEAIELTGKARCVALDKTGTVTTGKARVVDVIPADGVSKEELLETALSVEQYSEHPLARAVVDYASDKVTAREAIDFRSITGKGVTALLDGCEIYGAKYSYARDICDISDGMIGKYEQLASDGKTPLVFVKGGKSLGIIGVADTVKEDSARAVSELKALGMKVVMLTGDNSPAAERIGREVGVDEVISELLPQDKESVIQRLHAEGGVIMVGDGINDAPSLARADVGIAIGGGTDIAIDSADVVLMSDSLMGVARAVRLGRAAFRNICQNLFWAFIYNGIGIPLAAGVFIHLTGWEMTPMLGALAMSLSSFCVVINALRLNGFVARERRMEKRVESIKNDIEEKKQMKITMKIEGMMCPHCEARVKSTIEAICGEGTAEVSHKAGTAVVAMPDGASIDAIKSAVEAAGYPVTEIV